MMTAEPYNDYMFKHFSGFYDNQEIENVKCKECNNTLSVDDLVWDEEDRLNRCSECGSEIYED